MLSWMPGTVQMSMMGYFLRTPYDPGTMQNAKDTDIGNNLSEVPTKS